MLTFTDRQPAVGKENRYKLAKADGSFEYVTLERADEANPIGTPLNKTTFENMQTATIKDVFKIGSYSGNGQSGHFIEVGFKPRIVFIFSSNRDYALGDNLILGIRANDTMLVDSKITLVDNGFLLATTSDNINASGAGYNYIAFR